MLKVEKNAKNLDDAIALAAEELGVAKDEVSYTITKQIGKGLMKFLVGSEVEIVAWRTADEEKENAKMLILDELSKNAKYYFLRIMMEIIHLLLIIFLITN